MLEGLKRWISGKDASTGTGWDDLALWAEERQYPFRSVPGEGFVIDGRVAGSDWRLEWGPSQRNYVQGGELRLRAELPVSSALQLAVMNRALQESMEHAMFEQAVESVQTRIDNETPPETRWLVMFPKLTAADLGLLRGRFVAVSNMTGWLKSWLAGPLTQSLVSCTADASVPVVLMVSRGRLTLRTAVQTPDVGCLQPWIRLFETALREARRVVADKQAAAAEPDTGSAFLASALPEDEPKV